MFVPLRLHLHDSGHVCPPGVRLLHRGHPLHLDHALRRKLLSVFHEVINEGGRMRGTYKTIEFQSFPKDRPVRVHDLPNVGPGSRPLHHHLRHLYPGIFTGKTMDLGESMLYRELAGKVLQTAPSVRKRLV